VTARLCLFAALAALSAARADDPLPDKNNNVSGTVSAFNHIFKKNPDLAKKYVGRVLTVSGQVKDVAAAADGGQTVTLGGLPPTADDPAGCTVTFPAGSPSLAAAARLKAGAAVRVRGEVGSVTGAAFTLKNPVLVPAGTATAKKSVPDAADPAPEPGKKTAQAPAKPADPVKPAAPKPADPATAVKITAVELTTPFKDDKDDKAYRKFEDKGLEVEGEVSWATRHANGIGWVLRLKGCELKPGQFAEVRFSFDDGHPDLAAAHKIAEGDTVVVRGRFHSNLGANVALKDEQLLKHTPGPGIDRAPEVKTTAEAFAKQVMADPAAGLAKFRGKVVELTGTVGTAHPRQSSYGVSVTAGQSAPNRYLFIDCHVPFDQLEKVWLLARGQKVKVVGVVAGAEESHVRVVKCQVTELERNPMPDLTATALAAAYAKDTTAAAKKYGDGNKPKDLLLDGVVTTTKPSTQFRDSVAITVGASGKVAVVVILGTDVAAGLKPGDKVRFKAEVFTYRAAQGEVLLLGRLLKGPAAKK
jgi:hypothetical protein